jgi:hypothetical protein
MGIRALLSITTLCGALATAQLAPAATLAHYYSFDTDLSDSQGGPALVTNTGTVSGGRYVFTAGADLEGAGLLTDPADYTIDFIVALADLAGYAKLLDFKDLTTDDGLYILNSAVDFFPLPVSTEVMSPSVPGRLTVTRDAGTALMSVYLNGVLAISFDDSATNYGTFSSGAGIMHFFTDDATTSGGEYSDGWAEYIAIYNGAMTAEEVAAIPEPGTWGLTLAGAALLAARRRRRLPR